MNHETFTEEELNEDDDIQFIRNKRLFKPLGQASLNEDEVDDDDDAAAINYVVTREDLVDCYGIPH